MIDNYCTTCQHDIAMAATAPSMPAFTDLEITIPRRPSLARDIVPAMSGRTHGLRAAPLAARIAAHTRPQVTPWLCTCIVPAPCDGRCLVCGGSV